MKNYMRIFLAGILVSAAMSTALNAQDPGNGIHYSKTASFDYETMKGTITLECFVEGEVRTVPAPIDVVMVLDVSDSMDDKGKFDALKTSAKHIVSMLNDLVTSGGDARLGVVSFARNATVEAGLTTVNNAGATTLNSAIDGLTMGNTTNMDLGLNKAYGLLNTTESKAREQFILFFTDGKPGNSTGDLSVANATTRKAYELKKMGVQVFSILIWTESKIPSKSYISNTGDGDENLDEKYSVEQFLKVVSSQYPWYYEIDTDGGTDPTVNYRYYPDFGSTIAKTTDFSKIPKADTDMLYYRITQQVSDLYGIFEDIGNTIVSGATIELEETTVMKDILSTYCVLPPGADATSIKTYTADCTDYDSDTHEYTFGDKESVSGLTVTVDENTRTVDVTGYDYSGHWCGKNSSMEPVGQKLIVEVPFFLDASKIIEDHAYEVNLNLEGSGLYTTDGLLEVFIPAKFSYKTAIISVSGIKTGDSAVFEVTSTKSGTTRHAYTVVLTGKDDSGTSVSTSLLFLDPYATYTVTEQTPWNWTYDIAPGSSGSVAKDMTAELSDIVQFDFANVKKSSDLPVHGEAIKINDFTNDIVQTNVSVSDPESSTKKLYF